MNVRERRQGEKCFMVIVSVASTQVAFVKEGTERERVERRERNHLNLPVMERDVASRAILYKPGALSIVRNGALL